MKHTLLTAALVITGTASAATAVDGWYTSAFGGFTFMPSNISTFDNNRFVETNAYNTGYNVGARLGYQSNPIRYEGEYTYLSANLKYFNVNNVRQIAVEGESFGSLLMANIYYDFREILPAISPFLGAGIGYAMLDTSLNGRTPNGALNHFSISENDFAYQATAGLTYNFAEHYALNIAYRYAALGTKGDYGKLFQANLATAAVIYRFDKGNYK